MNCTRTVALGGYLLGALEPEDRSTFEAHLHGCDACRTELVRLSPLPGLLHQISLEDFEDLPEPDAMPPPAAEPAPAPAPAPVTEAPPPVPLDIPRAPEPADQPQRRRPYLLSAAAAVLVLVLTVGGILGYRALQEPVQPEATGVTWSATNPATGVHGNVELVEQGWGTLVNIRLDGVEPDKACWLVVRGHDGKRQTAGWWMTGHDELDGIPGSTAYSVDEIKQLEVVARPDNADATTESTPLLTILPGSHDLPTS